MKTLIATLLVATAIAAPAFAQSTTYESDVVIVGGKYIGQDPDANVRLMLKRDAGNQDF
jgi:hypothetical protein